MQELYQESIRMINFPWTVLVLAMLLYWLCVMLGFLDVHLLDFSPDGHADVDVGHHGFFSKALDFMHATETPFFVVLSVLATAIWSLSILSNYYLNAADSLGVGLLLFVPNFFTSVTLTRIIVLPIHKLFKALMHDPESRETIVGEICEVVSPKVDGQVGQAEVKTSGAPVLLNARTNGLEKALPKGTKAVVVRRNEDGTYIIKPMED